VRAEEEDEDEMTLALAGQDAGEGVLAGLIDDENGAAARILAGDQRGDLAKRLAALAVRRAANQHGCRGRDCRHPDHRRDVDFCRVLLEMIGLPGEYPEVTEADRVEYVTGVAQTIPHHGGRQPAPPKPPRERWVTDQSPGR
jgi:hypothetical protein